MSATPVQSGLFVVLSLPSCSGIWAFRHYCKDGVIYFIGDEINFIGVAINFIGDEKMRNRSLCGAKETLIFCRSATTAAQKGAKSFRFLLAFR